ncbi:MAG: hypothetical protein ACLP5H_32580, partial [Desulfomonilaceae bacterium]
TRLLTGLTSGELNIHIITGKQAFNSVAISRAYNRPEVLQPLLRPEDDKELDALSTLYHALMAGLNPRQDVSPRGTRLVEFNPPDKG